MDGYYSTVIIIIILIICIIGGGVAYYYTVVPVDCVVSPTAEDCSASCSTIQATVITPASGGGAACPGLIHNCQPGDGECTQTSGCTGSCKNCQWPDPFESNRYTMSNPMLVHRGNWNDPANLSGDANYFSGLGGIRTPEQLETDLAISCNTDAANGGLATDQSTDPPVVEICEIDGGEFRIGGCGSGVVRNNDQGEVIRSCLEPGMLAGNAIGQRFIRSNPYNNLADTTGGALTGSSAFFTGLGGVRTQETFITEPAISCSDVNNGGFANDQSSDPPVVEMCQEEGGEFIISGCDPANIPPAPCLGYDCSGVIRDLVANPESINCATSFCQPLECCIGNFKDINCQGHFSPCTGACEKAADRIWYEAQAQVSGGSPCPTPTDCATGEDSCVDARAAWERNCFLQNPERFASNRFEGNEDHFIFSRPFYTDPEFIKNGYSFTGDAAFFSDLSLKQRPESDFDVDGIPGSRQYIACRDLELTDADWYPVNPCDLQEHASCPEILPFSLTGPQFQAACQTDMSKYGESVDAEHPQNIVREYCRSTCGPCGTPPVPTGVDMDLMRTDPPVVEICEVEGGDFSISGCGTP